MTEISYFQSNMLQKLENFYNGNVSNDQIHQYYFLPRLNSRKLKICNQLKKNWLQKWLKNLILHFPNSQNGRKLGWSKILSASKFTIQHYSNYQEGQKLG